MPELIFWFSAGRPIVALWAMAAVTKRNMEKKDFILIDGRRVVEWEMCCQDDEMV